MTLQNNKIVKKSIFLSACCNQALKLGEKSFTIPAGFGYKLVNRLTLSSKYQSEQLGYIMQNKKNIVIVFKGQTGTTFDTGTFWNIFLEPYPFLQNSGQTQVGMNFAYKLVRNKIQTTLTKLLKRSPDKNVFVTGYDIGAGIATVAALDLVVNMGIKELNLYTFGSSKVGNPQFARIFNQRVKNSIRVANVHDWFIAQPNSVILPPFTKKTMVYSQIRTLFPLHFQCKPKVNNPANLTQVRNHNIENYFNALRLFDNKFTLKMCSLNKGFCPTITNDLCRNVGQIPIF